MEDASSIALRIVVFLLGWAIVGFTILSAVRSFVLPRSDNVWLTRMVFLNINRLFMKRTRHMKDYEDRDRLLAFFAPMALLSMPLIWLTLIMIGYTLIFWAVSDQLNWRESLVMSGSSLMTLGFKFSDEIVVLIIAFTEAALGMMFIALLIGYLPTMYSAFSAREAQVSKLEIRAGAPPSPFEMMRRLDLSGILRNESRLWDLWDTWETWFVTLEESHTVLGPLNFYRSANSNRHWVVAAGTVLDGAALAVSSINVPGARSGILTIRAGFVALRAIADFFRVKYDPNPRPDDPISITREEFDAAYDRLLGLGIPMHPDRDQCWHDFAGWRVNYDYVLHQIAGICAVKLRPWSELLGLEMIPAPRIQQHTTEDTESRL